MEIVGHRIEEPGRVARVAVEAEYWGKLHAGRSHELETIFDRAFVRLLVRNDLTAAKRRRFVGRVTTGGFGYAVGRSIALAYLPVAHAEVGTAVDIEVFGEWVAAEVAGEPLYDPKGERIRS